RGVADRADAERVGEEDRRLHQPPLHQLGEAGDLSGAVEHESAARHPLLEDVLLVGEDGGDAGAHRAPPAAERTGAADDGGMPHHHPFHVGDGVPLAGLEPAQRNSQLARARTLLHHFPDSAACSAAAGGGTETAPFPFSAFGASGVRAPLRRSRSRSLYRRMAPERISAISALYWIPAASEISTRSLHPGVSPGSGLHSRK